MDALILLTYGAIVIGAFKVFKFPVNAFTVVTAVLGGFGILAALLLSMNYNHPYTQVARFYFHTTPIVPQVQGKVVEVSVTDAQFVQQGDVLFRIQAAPYRNTVDQKKAQLVIAKQAAKEIELDRVAAEQFYKASLAELDAAMDTFERDKKLVGDSAVSESELEQSRQNTLSAKARSEQAKAQLDRAEQATLALVDGVNAQVADIEAQLATAEFNLEETTVRAPTDGRVLQVMVRPGMMAMPMPLKPVLIFQHKEEPFFIASFLQNNAQRIEAGNEVEVILPSVPGRFFRGTVESVAGAVAQGQLQASSRLVDAEEVVGEGRINVKVLFDEGELDGYQILPGSTGQAAVYTEHFHHLSVMRKVLLRMQSWTHFLFSDGHGAPSGH